MMCAGLAACTNPTNQPSASRTPSGDSSAPSGREAANQKKALVRFAQTVPGDQRLDLWFGDVKVFSNAAYKEVTPYIEVPAEQHDFKLQHSGGVQPAGEFQVLAANREGLKAGAHYTLIAERKNRAGAALTLDPLSDDLTPPSEGKAKLRVVNAAAGLGKVDVVGPDGRIFSGVGDDSSTSYKEIAITPGALEIRKSDRKADLLRITDANLQGGRVYTIFLIGGGAGAKLEAITITDQLTPPAGVGG
jgi:hypothetical protein